MTTNRKHVGMDNGEKLVLSFWIAAATGVLITSLAVSIAIIWGIVRVVQAVTS